MSDLGEKGSRGDSKSEGQHAEPLTDGGRPVQWTQVSSLSLGIRGNHFNMEGEEGMWPGRTQGGSMDQTFFGVSLHSRGLTKHTSRP